MQFSRHARNVLRLHKLSRDVAAGAIVRSALKGVDDRGNQRRIARVGDVTFIVVIAADQPDFVITLWKVS
jgi:hypothetical protein